MVNRLMAAWYAFLHPDKCPQRDEMELRALVKEILNWTAYKDTRWAQRAKEKRAMSSCGTAAETVVHNV